MSLRTPALLALVLVGCVALLAACGVNPTPTPSECVSADGGTLANSDCTAPGVTPDPTATPTPSGGNGGNGGGTGGQAVFVSNGCGACHIINSVPQARGQVGPDLSTIGAKYDAAYIRESIVSPNAVIAAGCPGGPCAAGVMPRQFGTLLTPEQLDSLVDFLAGLK